jgi:hypothetical protein
MPLIAIRGKTVCPRRVSVSLTAGFDSHRLHYLRQVWSCPRKPNTKLHTARPRRNSVGDIILSPLWG